jgi:hypothetical protein
VFDRGRASRFLAGGKFFYGEIGRTRPQIKLFLGELIPSFKGKNGHFELFLKILGRNF